MRGRFLARVAIFATLLVFIAVGGATLVFLLLASALGAALPAPHGALLAILAIMVAVCWVPACDARRRRSAT